MDKTPLLRRASFLVVLAAAVVVLAGADYLYFQTLEPAEVVASEPEPGPVSAAVATDSSCPYDDSKARVENYLDFVSDTDPSLGDPASDVVVIEFFDPNCPHCKTLHPILMAAVDSLADEARFVFRPFVISQASLMQVEALHIAAQQGKFFEMMDAQFERQTNRALSMAEMQEISEEIGLDFELLQTRLSSGMYRSLVLRQRQAAFEAGVSAVPSVMINGRFIAAGSRSVGCFAELIDEASQ